MPTLNLGQKNPFRLAGCPTGVHRMDARLITISSRSRVGNMFMSLSWSCTGGVEESASRA